MRLCMFRLPDGPPEGWPGRVEDNQILRLEAPDLIAVLACGGQVPVGAAVPADRAELLAPVPRPPSVRDFFAFEQHIATARANGRWLVPGDIVELEVAGIGILANRVGPGRKAPRQAAPSPAAGA